MNFALVQYITSGLNLGVLGIVFWLFVGGKLHSDREFTAMSTSHELERQRADHLQEALRLADQRGDMGSMAAQIVAQALGGVQQRQSAGAQLQQAVIERED